MSAPQGSKHPRAASTVSRNPKRVREQDADASGPGRGATRPQPRRVSVRKRTERDTTESDDEDDEATRPVEQGDTTAGEGDDSAHDISAPSRDAPDSDAFAEPSVVTRLHDAKTARKRTRSKAARTEAADSPSAYSRRVRKGKRDPFLTSAPGTKAKGKRVLEDDEDHEIGDEWTDLNGLRWRMGDDRELRREAIVVEMRLKYPNMPRDSRHPDSKLKVPVLVERFLTEAEYEEARSKKLLSFQEEERERERAAKEEEQTRELEKGQELQRKRIAESGRDVMTPRRIRNVQALFETSPRSKVNSPQRGSISYTVSQRPRSLSIPMSQRMSLDSPERERMSVSLSSTSLTTPSQSQHKRLSLSRLDSDESMRRSATSSPLQPLPLSLSEMPPPTAYSTPRHRASTRVPLVSPASPAAGLRKASSPASAPRDAGASEVKTTLPSRAARWFSPLANLVAKRKREEGLVKILQQEADRRKQREQQA